MNSNKAFRVRFGNSSVRVSRHAKGWRFGYREGARWRYVTRRKRAEIVEAAERILAEQATGLVWSGLDRETRAFLEAVHAETRLEDREAVLASIRARRASEEVGGAVGRFLGWKEENAGRRTRHLGQVRGVLEQLAEHFAGRAVVDIPAHELEAWWRTRGEGLSTKRRKDMRGMLVMFWNWAKREGIAGAEAVTVAERLPSPKVGHGSRRVLTAAELVALLNEVREDFRAWVVLGAWAGLRPEEIAPQAASKKAGLCCEDIDWSFGVVRVSAAVANKVRRPRVVPMSAALRAGLEWAGIKPGMTGAVVLGDPARDGETLRLGKAIFVDGWPQDALRHSYGSYRNAVLRNLPQVAEEMGTSETMLHRHYHNPRAEAEGVEWFEGIVRQRSSSEGDAWVLKGSDGEGERATSDSISAG